MVTNIRKSKKEIKMLIDTRSFTFVTSILLAFGSSFLIWSWFLC